ncbi:MAG: flagellar filament capping protein FliD [Candidatus Desulforudis sp.]|nr:flagellar filament capping protein FliD [Desulforudis sp.]
MSLTRIGGLATGIDTYQMIQDLMKAHRKPVDKLLQQRQVLQWRQEDYRGINAALLNFRNAVVSPLRFNGTFQAKTVESSNTAVVTATAPSTAATAIYDVTVHELATTAYRTSRQSITRDGAEKIDPDATLWSQYELEKFDDSWTIDPETKTFEFSLTTYNQDGTTNNNTFVVDATQKSLNEVLADINNAGELKLTVFYDATADMVSISTKHTGDNNAGGYEIGLDLDGEGQEIGFLAQALQLGNVAGEAEIEQGGTNAQATVNGMTIERAGNIFTLNDVNFSLKAAGSSTVTVRGDTDAVFQQIKNFIDEYNKLLDLINGKLQEERFRDYLPLLDDDPARDNMTERQIDQWEQKARSGLLRHDTILSGIVNRMRADVFSPVAGLDESLNHLMHIGITVGSFADQGKLIIDEAKLRNAIEQDPADVAKLFNQSGATTEEQGIGHRLYGYLDTAVKRVTAQAGSSTYTSSYDPSWLGRQISGLDERVHRAEARLERLEDRYWKQFTALERAINQMNTQSMWLMQQFGGGTYQG